VAEYSRVYEHDRHLDLKTLAKVQHDQRRMPYNPEQKETQQVS
jgi:hypothetical protein